VLERMLDEVEDRFYHRLGHREEAARLAAGLPG
jgi:hypothetical protein